MRFVKQSTLLLIITVILVLLSLFQLLLILGVPLGRAAWGGQNEVLPTVYRIASAFSILIYGGILWLAHQRVSRPEGKGFQIAVWIIFAYFCLGVILNAITPSVIEHIWVPMNLILAWAFFLLGKSRKQKTNQTLSK